MNIYAEFVVNIFTDGVAERNDFIRRCATQIDQHQRLLVVHPCPTE